MHLLTIPVLAWFLVAEPAGTDTLVQSLRVVNVPACPVWDSTAVRRNPTPTELRCRFGFTGLGRFGLHSHADLPVYQPATPLPGTHTVLVPGLPKPDAGESYEEWEWRILRTEFGPEARRIERGLDVLDPTFASRLRRLEERLAEEGIQVTRRETWRSPERQAYLFQQGRSRPGPLATATLTSWHSTVDSAGRPAGRAADYVVGGADLERFHQVVAEVGLQSFGPASNDAGHVFLPPPEILSELDIVLLRLLPRVPFVSLATGRPSDENSSPARLAEYRRICSEFVRAPFLPRPPARLAGAGTMIVRWTAAVSPPATTLSQATR